MIWRSYAWSTTEGHGGRRASAPGPRSEASASRAESVEWFQAAVEEGHDAPPGVLRRRLVVAGGPRTPRVSKARSSFSAVPRLERSWRHSCRRWDRRQPGSSRRRRPSGPPRHSSRSTPRIHGRGRAATRTRRRCKSQSPRSCLCSHPDQPARCAQPPHPRMPFPARHAGRGRSRANTSSSGPIRRGWVPWRGSLRSPPVGLGAQVLAHPEGIVNDHDPRPRRLARRCRQMGGHLSARTRDLDLGHRLSSALGGREAYVEMGALAPTSFHAHGLLPHPRWPCDRLRSWPR